MVRPAHTVTCACQGTPGHSNPKPAHDRDGPGWGRLWMSRLRRGKERLSRSCQDLPCHDMMGTIEVNVPCTPPPAPTVRAALRRRRVLQ